VDSPECGARLRELDGDPWLLIAPLCAENVRPVDPFLPVS